MFRLLPALLLGWLSLAAGRAWSADTIYELKPAGTGVSSYVLFDPSVAMQAPLAVFLPGTNGQPANAARLLHVVADQGFRVLGLAYDDAPAVSQTCPQDPDPGCSEAFRQMRVDGTGPGGPVQNPVAEAIVPRLVATLQALAMAHPNQDWGGYLDAGAPRWNRIVVSGLSQGAGMAAYIAKHHAVARVVLFSSPWDVTGPDQQPAPWLYGPSATPPGRWYAEYHRRENTAALLRQAYRALNLAPDHILVFDQDLPPGAGHGDNPFHPQTIHDVRYADDWRVLFGHP